MSEKYIEYSRTGAAQSNIVLCGFTSCGKSTIGRLLAEMLGRPFTDTDTLLAETFHMTIPALFSAVGEARFREYEYEIAQTAARLERAVIATGGGMMENERCAALFAEHGTVIFIDEDFDICYARLSSDPERPLVKNNSKEQLRARYERRIPGYQKYAAYTLAHPAGAHAAAEEIIQFINGGFQR